MHYRVQVCLQVLAVEEGPTVLWDVLKGKKVKTNDGKELGEIKEFSQNYVRVEKGTVRKDSLWIPKYVGDAFDGHTLWLLISEEEASRAIQVWRKGRRI